MQAIAKQSCSDEFPIRGFGRGKFHGGLYQCRQLVAPVHVGLNKAHELLGECCNGVQLGVEIGRYTFQRGCNFGLLQGVGYLIEVLSLFGSLPAKQDIALGLSVKATLHKASFHLILNTFNVLFRWVGYDNLLYGDGYVVNFVFHDGSSRANKTLLDGRGYLFPVERGHRTISLGYVHEMTLTCLLIQKNVSWRSLFPRVERHFDERAGLLTLF